LVPSWAKDIAIGTRMINARSDSVAKKPVFRGAFAKRRCLVPADGFYEWHKAPGPKAPKQRYTIAMRTGEPMAFAGLWEGWRGEGGAIVRTFTIVTTDANDKLRPLHDRMPVILARDVWPAWLGEKEAKPDDLVALLRLCPPEWLAVWPVPRRVGRVTEDDAGLAERDPTALALTVTSSPALLRIAARISRSSASSSVTHRSVARLRGCDNRSAIEALRRACVSSQPARPVVMPSPSPLRRFD